MRADDHRAYLTITRFGGDPRQLADAYRTSAETMASVGRDHGVILHAGATTSDGFLVVNLWPSSEGAEAASRDPRRIRALAESGVDPAHIRAEHHEVVDYLVLR